MPKYRSREIVEAEQWFPGKDMKLGVVIEATACGFVSGDVFGGWMRLEPGDYVVKWKNGLVGASSREHFEECYENIGG